MLIVHPHRCRRGKHLTLLAWVVIAMLPFAGCRGGGQSATPGAAGGSGNTVDGAAGGGGNTVDVLTGCSTPLAPCPQTDTPGAPCPVVGQYCEFDDDPRIACRHRRRLCDANKTLASSGGAGAGVPPCAPLTSGPPCGATLAAFAGTPCDPNGDDATRACLVEGQACTCQPCSSEVPYFNCKPSAPQGSYGWTCDQITAGEAGCPSVAPRLGSACQVDALTCQYDYPSCGQPREVRVCACGVWQAHTVTPTDPCPISRRAAKTDITPLGPEQRRALVDHTLNLKLSTGRYRRGLGEAPDRLHLGMIIDDHPDSFAVDAEAGRMDLYGLASLLLLVTQQQAADIATLKAEVASACKGRAEP